MQNDKRCACLKEEARKATKKEIKHQKYIDKRKYNSKSEEFFSDDTEDVLPQRGVRFLLQKGEDELGFSSTSSKMHGPQSDDTVILILVMKQIVTAQMIQMYWM